MKIRILRASTAGALLALAAAVQGAAAADLVEVWQAAVRSDREYAVSRARQAAAQPRREQASALWKPTIGVSASIGLATQETSTRGAQFSAPGFARTDGVGFDTSVTGGTAGRWAIVATQPLYNPGRRAQQQQLNLSADRADVDVEAAGQALMLRTAERYFDLALAEETVRVLGRQQDAVQRAGVEAQDRFKLGAAPVTDTHEAAARAAGVRAQLLAAEREVQIKRNLLADSTGLPDAELAARLPAGTAADRVLRPLEPWLRDAEAGNLGLRSQLLAVELARREADQLGRRASASVDLVAQAGRDRSSGSGDFGSAGNTAVNRLIGIQLSVPLYTGGYRSARQEEALRRIDEASAEVEHLRQQVGQQVRAAWLGLSVGAERVRSLDEALVASAARRDATQLGHEIGQRTTLDLLNAENDLAAARLALAQARSGLLIDRLRLAALAGALDEAALRSVNDELAQEMNPPRSAFGACRETRQALRPSTPPQGGVEPRPTPSPRGGRGLRLQARPRGLGQAERLVPLAPGDTSGPAKPDPRCPLETSGSCVAGRVKRGGTTDL